MSDRKEVQGRVTRHGNAEPVHHLEPDYHQPLFGDTARGETKNVEEARLPLRGRDRNGKRNDVEAALTTESKRAINRTVLDYELLVRSYEDPENKLYRIRELGGWFSSGSSTVLFTRRARRRF